MDNINAPRPFYGEGPDSTRIANPDDARDIATAGNGEAGSRDREAELKRQAETGLTKEQEANIIIMKGLQEKYPDAFPNWVDEKGRQALFVKDTGDQFISLGNTRELIVCEEGIFGHISDSRPPYLGIEDLDLGKVIDSLKNQKADVDRDGFAKFVPSRVLSTSGLEKFHYPGIAFKRLNLASAGTKEALKTVFERVQTIVTDKRKQEEEFRANMDPQKILSEL